MSVYKSKGRKTFVYDFWYAGQHYRDNTFQTDLERAKLVEAKLKLQLRERRGGIALPGPSPRIVDWAGVYYTWCETQRARTGRPRRLDVIDAQLRVVLRFFGASPSDPALQPAVGEDAPFHDLTLQDLIDEPQWIEDFEAWIDRRNVAGGTRNHYLTRMSRLYAVAMLPKHRKATGVKMNPFEGVARAPKRQRKVALTPELVIAWIGAMSYHTRLAVAIAALAPKLRLSNILKLDRYRDIDQGVTRISVGDHKSVETTGAPLVVPVSAQLQAILLDAFARMKPPCTNVVQYRGEAIKSIRAGVAAAARQVGIPYGRFVEGGATFHTLRHTGATIFARLGVTPWLQRDAMGHQDLSTTQGYTHLQVEEQRPAFEALSAELPIQNLVTAPTRRASRKMRGPQLPTGEISSGKQVLTRGAYALAGRRFQRKAQ